MDKTNKDIVTRIMMNIDIINTYAPRIYAYKLAILNNMSWTKPEITSLKSDKDGKTNWYYVPYETYIEGAISNMKENMDKLSSVTFGDDDFIEVRQVLEEATLCIDRYERIMKLLKAKSDKKEKPNGSENNGGIAD